MNRFVLGVTLLLVAGSVSVARAASPEAGEPRYLVFWGEPEKVVELKGRIGAAGDGKSRLLAFGLPTPAFDGEPVLPGRIRDAFQAARKHDIPVHLEFDFHTEWKGRPDLWNWFDPKLPGLRPGPRPGMWNGRTGRGRRIGCAT